jgi:5-methylcytosine-specific restriction endonuclease McrA
MTQCRHWITAEYRSYMSSPEWRQRRSEVLARDEGRCRRCGGPATEVHHLTYARFGSEPLTDLLSVCGSCHEGITQATDRVRERNAQDALDEARLDGWATKVFGSNWDRSPGYEEAERRFEAWLRKKGETW